MCIYCIGVCTCACGYVCRYVHPSMGARGSCWFSLIDHSPYLLLRQGLTIPEAHEFGYTGCPKCIRHLPITIPLYPFPVLGLQVCTILSGFSYGFWNLKSDSHACMIGTLLIEPSPQTPFQVLIYTNNIF